MEKTLASIPLAEDLDDVLSRKSFQETALHSATGSIIKQQILSPNLRPEIEIVEQNHSLGKINLKTPQFNKKVHPTLNENQLTRENSGDEFDVLDTKQMALVDEKMTEKDRKEYFHRLKFKRHNIGLDANSCHQSIIYQVPENQKKKLKDQNNLLLKKEVEEMSKTEKTAEFNKELWMRSYAIKFEIPACYVLDARVFAHNTLYIFQVCKYVVPDESRTKSHIIPPKKEYDNYDGNILLRLQKNENNQLVEKGEAIIKDAMNIKTCFSQDGTMFAYLVKEYFQDTNDEDNTLMKAPTRRADAINSQQRDQNRRQRLFVVKNTSGDPLKTLKFINEGEKRLKQGVSLESENSFWRVADIDSFDQTDKETEEYLENMQDKDKKNYCFEFVEDISFDVNNNFLVGYGKLQFFIFDMKQGTLNERRCKVYHVSDSIYDYIVSIRFCSGGGLSKEIYEKICNNKNMIENIDEKINKCYLAVQRFEANQIHVFDFFEDQEERNQDHDCSHIKDYENEHKNTALDNTAEAKVGRELVRLLSHLDHVVIVNYTNKPTKDMLVGISYDMSTILFQDRGQRFVIETNDKMKLKRNLNFIPINETSKYIEEDFEERGFYIVTAKDYDKKVRIWHTHRPSFKLGFKRNVEPNNLRFFDLFVKNLDINSWSDAGSNRNRSLMLLGLDQNLFFIDEHLYKEKPRNGKKVEESIQKYEKALENHGLSALGVADFEMEKGESYEHSYNQIGCFSINWPLLSYADRQGSVYVANCFQKSRIHQIRVDQHLELREKGKVELTFITDNNQLFVLVIRDGIYRLYSVDLQHVNDFRVDQFEKKIQKKEDMPKGDRDKLGAEDAKKELENTIHFGDPILEYKADTVKKQDAVQMYVRDKSKSEDNNSLDKLVVIILHGTILWSWTQRNHKPFGTDDQLEVISEIDLRRFRTGLNNTIYYLTKETEQDEVKKQDIVQLKIGHVMLEKKIVYSESDSGNQEDLKSFDYDETSHKLLMLFKSGVKKSKSHLYARKLSVKIYDITNRVIEMDMEVNGKLLSGLLVSGMYNFLAGHIYFANNVIKIRYDLLKEENHSYSEEDIFNTYEDILKLRKGCMIDTGTLLLSYRGHRFGFLQQDVKNQLLPSTLIITPWLHERRIYYGNNHPNNKYFTTSIELPRAKRIEFNQWLQGKLKLQDKDLDQTMKFGKQQNLQLLDDNHNQTCIVRMNLTGHRFHVYSQNGVLIRRVNFERQQQLYGEPIAASNNGQYLIFRRRLHFLRQLERRTKNDEDPTVAVKKAFVFSIMKLSPFGLTFVKHVDIIKGIGEVSNRNLKELPNWLQPKDIDEFAKNININIIINDNADIIVRLISTEKAKAEQDIKQSIEDYILNVIKRRQQTNKSKRISTLETSELFDSDQSGEYDERLCSIKEDEIDDVSIKDQQFQIFYFESSKTRNDGNKQFQQAIKVHVKAERQIYPSDLEQPIPIEWTGFNMNSEYLFFWNDSKIAKFSLSQDWDTEPEQLKISIHENQLRKGRRFDKVRVGSDPNNIAIIQQNNSDNGYTVITWNVKLDHEFAFFDVQAPFFLAFDSNGLIQTVHGGQVALQQQQCELTCFDYDLKDVQRAYADDLVSAENMMDALTLGISKGHRFDGKNHNWLLFDEYMATPFCYMTFAIKAKIENCDPCILGRRFDPEPYNYIFNRCSSFLDGDFSKKNVTELKRVLQYFDKNDVANLELLQYFNARPSSQLLEYLLSIKQLDGKILMDLTNMAAKGAEEQFADYCMDLFARHENSCGDWFCCGSNEIQQPSREAMITINSPLQGALLERNTDCINTLLTFMAKIGRGYSRYYKNIFVDLVEYKAFSSFLDSLAVQTQEMKQKQVLNVTSKLNDEVIACGINNSRQIDDNYYTQVFDEAEDSNQRLSTVQEIEAERFVRFNKYHIYPVEIVSVRYGWMQPRFIGTDGREFLEQIYYSGDLSYYRTRSLKAIIQHFYSSVQWPVYTFFVLHLLDFLSIALVGNFMENIAEEIQYKRADGAERVPWNSVTKENENAVFYIAIYQGFFILLTIFNEFIRFFVSIRCSCKRVKLTNILDVKLILLTFELITKGIMVQQVIEIFFGNKTSVVAKQFDNEMWQFRIALAYAIIFHGLSLLLILQVIPAFGELADIIRSIVVDALSFIALTAYTIGVFSVVFYLFGREQIFQEVILKQGDIYLEEAQKLQKPDLVLNAQEKIDALNAKRREIEYSDGQGAIWYVYKMVVGLPDDGMFNQIEDSLLRSAIRVAYGFASFSLILIMLNVLIAIMGTTQGKRSEAVKEIKQHVRLVFILDNWHFLKISNFISEQQDRYIICALAAEREEVEDEDIEDLMTH